MGNVPSADDTTIESWFPLWTITLQDFPRYRSVTVYPDKPLVVVRTRTGGGNREEYDEDNERLRQLEGFMEDEDDSFDCTYAYWHYEIPEASRPAWRAYCDKNAAHPPGPTEKVVIPTDWTGETPYGASQSGE
jgi:hypothetical protein